MLVHSGSSIYSKIDDGNCTVLLTLDLTAAFDTINHDKLILELYNYGIAGTALKWFKSFLSNRSFNVLTHHKSEKNSLSSGVPQGGILSPTLYILYTTSIESIFKFHNTNYHIYADDNYIYLSFSLHELSNTACRINKIMYDIQYWTKEMFLQLNISKNQLIYFGNKPNIEHLYNNYPSLQIDNNEIEAKRKIKTLGYIINSSISQEEQINQTIKNCSYELSKLWRIKNI